MPNRNPNRIRQRDERGHPVVRDALKRGLDISGEQYVISGLPGHDVANESRLVISRALEHFGYPRACRVIDQDGNPCYKDCQDVNAPHGIAFRLLGKAEARAFVTRQAGGNPANLKYNPYKRRAVSR